MRRLILGCLLAITAGTVLADRPEDTCARASVFAEGAMKARQSGMPLAQAMANSVDDKAVRYILARAYGFPLVDGSADRERAIREFQNVIYLDCYQRFSD